MRRENNLIKRHLLFRKCLEARDDDLCLFGPSEPSRVPGKERALTKHLMKEDVDKE